MGGINSTLKEQNSTLEQFLTKKEVMDHLRIKDEHTFYKLVKEGLPIKKIGNRTLIPVQKYKLWLNTF